MSRWFDWIKPTKVENLEWTQYISCQVAPGKIDLCAQIINIRATICSNPSPVLHQSLQAKKRNSSHQGGEQEVLLKIHLLSWKQSGRRKSAEFVKEGKNLWYSIYTTLLIPRPNECWVVQPSTRSLKEHVATRGLNVCCCCVRCRAKKALYIIFKLHVSKRFFYPWWAEEIINLCGYLRKWQ